MWFMSKEEDKVESLDEKKKFVSKCRSFPQGRRPAHGGKALFGTEMGS